MKKSKLILLIISFSVVFISGVSRADNNHVLVYVFPQLIDEGSSSSLLASNDIIEHVPSLKKNSPIRNEFFATTTLFNDKLQQLIASIYRTSSTKIIRGEDSITSKARCTGK